MRIGISINEAIDWAQDKLITTRPLAERTLFALIAASLGGYISRYLYTKSREAVKESVVPQDSMSSDRSGS